MDNYEYTMLFINEYMDYFKIITRPKIIKREDTENDYIIIINPNGELIMMI